MLLKIMADAYFYLGTYSGKGNNRVSAYRSQGLAWMAACHRWPAKPLRDRDEAMAWLLVSTSAPRARFYLRQAEKTASRLPR